MELFFWIYLCSAYISFVYGSDCVFPEEWRDRWHEGRRTEISAKSMSRKGTCIRRDGNKFFMLNKDATNRKCFTCLVFTQWHLNLLQYKESPCWYEQKFHHVCGLINGDTILHTLVRAPSSPPSLPRLPVTCPFHGSYTFSYTNGTMSNQQCDSPLSEVRACADESKFKFIFKKCNRIPGTHDRAMDFQCLASWENGDKYLYGSFSEPWMTSVDDYQYRCFMHSFYGTNGDMSMSADSTCQGLQSPTLGVITMKFSKDLNEPRGSCSFPDILVNRNKWRDLSGKWLLDVEQGLHVLRLKDRQPKGTMQYSEPTNLDASSTKLVIRCVEKTHHAETIKADVLRTDYVTYVTDDSCESGYQCVRLVKRDENILEMYLGERVNGTSINCRDKEFNDATKHLLIPDVNDSGQCSITRKGIYDYQDKASDCRGTVNIGCSTPNKITIDTKCPANKYNVKTEKVEILHCLYSWTVGAKTYIIIQNSGQRAKCLTFIDTEHGVELQSDDSCQSDRWTVTNQYLNYLLYNHPDPCIDDEIQADQNTSNERTDVEEHKDINAISSVQRTSFFLPTIVCNFLLFLLLRVR
ncbi:uncharacterized protein LOC132754542 [Ruditapes philippinarum]|uniref:uncharacterized protein LOC132754542 n=1 Tax=Ruditapes philippinarum TaxID=129788 RepID=UPI00295B972A|nr:uncharacterized protein LOC132754542 [Ruditapes philippinarum]